MVLTALTTKWQNHVLGVVMINYFKTCENIGNLWSFSYTNSALVPLSTSHLILILCHWPLLLFLPLGLSPASNHGHSAKAVVTAYGIVVLLKELGFWKRKTWALKLSATRTAWRLVSQLTSLSFPSSEMLGFGGEFNEVMYVNDISNV